MKIKRGHFFSKTETLQENEVSFMLRKISIKWFSDSSEITFLQKNKQQSYSKITMSKIELEKFIEELQNLNKQLEF